MNFPFVRYNKQLYHRWHSSDEALLSHRISRVRLAYRTSPTCSCTCCGENNSRCVVRRFRTALASLHDVEDARRPGIRVVGGRSTGPASRSMWSATKSIHALPRSPQCGALQSNDIAPDLLHVSLYRNCYHATFCIIVRRVALLTHNIHPHRHRLPLPSLQQLKKNSSNMPSMEESKTPHGTVEKIVDSVCLLLIERIVPFDLTTFTGRCC